MAPLPLAPARSAIAGGPRGGLIQARTTGPTPATATAPTAAGPAVGLDSAATAAMGAAPEHRAGVDVDDLTNRVYDRLISRLAIERERRGL